MKKIVVFVVVYLLSAFAMYKWVQIAYSEQGRCKHKQADTGDVIATFAPVLNTFFAVLGWSLVYPYADQNCNRFFNIKTTNNDTNSNTIRNEAY